MHPLKHPFGDLLNGMGIKMAFTIGQIGVYLNILFFRQNPVLMSFPIILIVMLCCGLLGGLINYLLPANDNTDTGKKIRPGWQCILLGLGATLLVPLFLEIAQSKLL